MGRQKKGLWIPKDVSKMADIISLFIDKHAAGYMVLAGCGSWPDLEELHEMLQYVHGSAGDTGVHVQGGPALPLAQRRIEAIESAEWVYTFLNKFGGAQVIACVMRDYARQRPRESEILRRVGMAGFPGAKSIEALAGEFYVDVKTLCSMKNQAITEIAFGIVYYEKNFRLAPDDHQYLKGEDDEAV